MERFTISLDESLAAAFDELIKERGYANRSEAVRDVLRSHLQQSAEKRDDKGSCVANLSYVYSHRERELAERLVDFTGVVAVDGANDEPEGVELIGEALVALLWRDPVAMGKLVAVEDGDDVGERVIGDEVGGFPVLASPESLPKWRNGRAVTSERRIFSCICAWPMRAFRWATSRSCCGTSTTIQRS